MSINNNDDIVQREKSMKRLFIVNSGILLTLLLANAGNLIANENRLNVVTTTSDLAYIARQVGGTRVEVQNLLAPTADPHFADARPDYIVKLNRADVLALIGMDLEVGWLPPVLQQSRNPKIFVGSPGYCDASIGIHVLEKPTTGVSRSMGDIHVFGNPHYWTDPVNAAIMARNLRDAFIRVDGDHRDTYERNFQSFFNRMRVFTNEQISRFAPAKGVKVAVYHKEFVYLAERFGFQTPVSLEEKPGVPPSAAYLKKVVEDIKREGIRIILISPYNNPRYANSVAERTGAKVIVMPTSTGTIAGIDTYEKSVSRMLDLIRENR